MTILSMAPRRLWAMSGDDFWWTITLFEDGIPAVLTSATITAAVRNLSDVLAIGPYVQSSSSPGASWGTGVVVIHIPYPDTKQLFTNSYFLEIETNLSPRGYRTWPKLRFELDQYTISH